MRRLVSTLLSLAGAASLRAQAPVAAQRQLELFDDARAFTAAPSDGVTLSLRADTGMTGSALRMEFDFSAAGRTQLALVCSDRPGLLAHVAAALRECQLRVHDARIATFGERVEDFFELTDQGDCALNATQLDTLRDALRRHIETSAGAGGAESRHDIEHA